MLDKECGSDSKIVEQVILDLLDVCFEHTELSTYLILFGNNLQNISDIRRRYIAASVEFYRFSSKFQHREIITNICLTEDYINKELTYFYPLDDYEQMWSISKVVKRFGSYLDDLYEDQSDLYDYRSDEMKKIYDCWACLSLNIQDPQVKDHVLDNVSSILGFIVNIICTRDNITGFRKGFINMTAKPTKQLAQMICNTVYDHCNFKYRFEDITTYGEDIEIIKQGINYMVGYVWLHALKLAVMELSKTFDSTDYLDFIHTMYEISRHNYNNNTEVN